MFLRGKSKGKNTTMYGEEQVGNVEQDIQLLMISIYVVIVLKRVSILRDPFAQAPSRSRHRLQPEALVLIYSCLCLIYSYNVPLHQCRISTPSRYAGYPLRLSLLYSTIFVYSEPLHSDESVSSIK